MQLPVLHLCVRGVPSLLMVNGTLAGESENEPVIPVSPDGKAFVTCLPFATDDRQAVVLPHTVALTFEQGILCTPVAGCTAYLEADGLTHIELHPIVVPLQNDSLMPVALSKASVQWRGHAVFATLMREESVYIAIEDRNHNRLGLLYDIADMTEGQCQAVRCLTESDFLVTGQGPQGPRAVLCTPVDNGTYRVAADEYATAEATPGALLCTKECEDICAHQARYTIAIAAGEPAASAPTYGYFTHKRREPSNAQQVCGAFCQAIQLERIEEALGYVNNELGDGLTLDDLHEFFGPFTSVYAYQGEPNITVSLAYAAFENGYTVRRFLFTMEGMQIANIAPV